MQCVNNDNIGIYIFIYKNEYIIILCSNIYVIEKTTLHYTAAAIFEIFEAVSNEKNQKKNCGGDTVGSLSARDSYTVHTHKYIRSCITYYNNKYIYI